MRKVYIYIIDVLNNSYFVRAKDSKPIKKFFKVSQTIRIPTMVRSEAEARVLASVGGTASAMLLTTLIIPVIFMLFINFRMSLIWSLYNTMQVIATI